MRRTGSAPDYEFARPSHALLDGIYWRMGFPTCWCAGRTPADVATRIDAAYRMELGTPIPLALDDRAYCIELAYMSAAWLFTCLSWRLDDALERDETWGIWSIRGRPDGAAAMVTFRRDTCDKCKSPVSFPHRS